ncbi:MAG: phosphate regulon sensor histidine kinase PhoR [Rhodanobacteraceae bacterium]
MRQSRRTLERRLVGQLHGLRRAADALSDALVLLDDAGALRWCNAAAGRLLGLDRRRDRGAALADIFASSELGAWLRQGSNDPINDVAAPGSDAVRLTVSIIRFGDNQRLLMARDIGHLSRLEQMRRDLVANVSHELRTPLTIIHGYLELLEPEDVPALAPVLSEMRMQSQRMGQIVEDLLTLSRLTTRQELPRERVEMGPMLAVLLKEGEALSQGRHRIRLEVNSDAALLGSPQELHSAFSNLVSNAVRYTPTGGDIFIRWQREPYGASYSVTDTGFGIAANHLARLTERFYRVSSCRSRESGGTGLGLSIVKHVLELHQARLLIESEPGKGSSFTCAFGRERVLSPGTVQHDACAHGN